MLCSKINECMHISMVLHFEVIENRWLLESHGLYPGAEEAYYIWGGGAKRNKMIIIFIVTDRKRTYHIWEQDDNYFIATEITKH